MPLVIAAIGVCSSCAALVTKFRSARSRCSLAVVLERDHDGNRPVFAVIGTTDPSMMNLVPSSSSRSMRSS